MTVKNDTNNNTKALKLKQLNVIQSFDFII